jgi:hypothetical protein
LEYKAYFPPSVLRVTRCTFEANAAPFGSGFYAEGARTSVDVDGCRFVHHGLNSGPAFSAAGVFPHVSHSLFAANTSIGNHGGAVSLTNAPAILTSCTIAGNSSAGSIGAGIYASASGMSSLLIDNTILWDNHNASASGEAQQIAAGGVPVTIDYSCVAGWTGGLGGIGNFGLDPLFWDVSMNDYHLQSSSPCIDTGDPSLPLDPDGTRADIGAYPFDPNH